VLLGGLGLAVKCTERTAPGDDIQIGWSDRPEAADLSVKVEEVRQMFTVLSGERECRAPRDHLGRVSAASLDCDLSRPELSEWAWALAKRLAALSPHGHVPGPRLAVYLTHDVDRVRPLEPMGMGGMTGRALRGVLHGDVRPARAMLRWMRSARHFLDTYETLMRLEREAGATATYFVMSGPYSVRRYGARVGQGRRLRRLLERIGQSGHRIGLHGCAYSLTRDDYGRQRAALAERTGHPVTWHRNHYLVYDPARSPAMLEAAGFAVDSTCGFHDTNGFRAGVAWPYPLWDWQQDRRSSVMEIPLIFMDGACPGGPDAEWGQLYERLERAEVVAGTVAVLFHADYFVGRPERIARYEGLLTWLGNRSAVLDAPECGTSAAIQGRFRE